MPTFSATYCCWWKNVWVEYKLLLLFKNLSQLDILHQRSLNKMKCFCHSFWKLELFPVIFLELRLSARNCICHLGDQSAHQPTMASDADSSLSSPVWPQLLVAPLRSTLLCKNNWAALPNIHFSAFCAKMFAKYQHRQLIKRHWQGVWKWQKGSGSVNGSPLSRLGLAEYRQHSGEKSFFPAMASNRSGGRGQ